jgi:hypothetical protein
MSFAEGMESGPRMTERMRKKKYQGFNWKNIEDNGDGTFTAYDGRAKKRLLVEYHRQGIRVRSSDNGDGTWKVTPIGVRSPLQASPRYNGRPRYYGRRPHTVQPYLGPRPMLSPVAGPSPIIGGGPSRARSRGESFLDKTIRRPHESREAEKQRKAMLQETNEKLKQDRLAEERKETARQVSERAEKRRLLVERQQFERSQQAQKMRNTSTMQQGIVTGSNASPKSSVGPLFSPAPKPSTPQVGSDAAAIREARKINLSGEL